MKKRLLFTLLTSSIAFWMNSCQRNNESALQPIDSEEQRKEEIRAAQQWFENNHYRFDNRQAAKGRVNKYKKLNPEWKKVLFHRFSKKAVIEVPLLFDNTVLDIRITEKERDQTKTPGRPKRQMSISKLLLSKDEKEGYR